MNKFLAKKERGESILFSELLADIPDDNVLHELFPDPHREESQLVTHRGLEVLKLRLEGLRQPEIAEKLSLTRSQVAYASKDIKNHLYNNVPPYINVDMPALRKILGLPRMALTGYTLLSELLQDMPSDDELVRLFLERGNLMGHGKQAPTNRDLQLLQMRQQRHNYESIGADFGMEANEVRRQIKLTLTRIRRDLKIELDVPALYKCKKQVSTLYKCKKPSSVRHPLLESCPITGDDGTVIFSKPYSKFDVDEFLKEHEVVEDISVEAPKESFGEFIKRITEESVYIIRPDKIASQQKFIDLAVELSKDYNIAMEITKHFYYITVTMYLDCASCVGEFKEMISELINLSDRISTFIPSDKTCDFIVSLDYYTHDHYIADRKVDF